MRLHDVQERWNRVQNAVNKIKLLPGVRDAHIDDSNMDDTGFNVDVSYFTEGLREGLRPAYCHGNVKFVFKDLRSIVQKINAVIHKEGLSSNSVDQPQRVYDTCEYRKYYHGYNRTWGRFDVRCY